MSVTPLPTPPSRQDPSTFNERTNQFLAALPQYKTQMDALGDNVEAKEQLILDVLSDIQQIEVDSNLIVSNSNNVLQDSILYYDDSVIEGELLKGDAQSIYEDISLYANYKGDWNTLTGAYIVPSVVRHQGSFWQLVQDVVDITLEEPSSTSSVWVVATSLPTSGGDIGDVIYTPNDIEASGKYLECDGRVLLQNSYPQLFGKIGVGDKPAPSSLLPVPSDPPNGASRDIAVSPENTYTAVIHSLAPFLTIYKRNGDIFTKLPDPSYLPTSALFQISFSNSGDYLAVGVSAAPRVVIYKRSGDTFTKLPDPSQLPSGAIISVKFSPDDTYLVMGYATSPYTFVYKRNGDTFTKLPDLPATASTVNGIDFSNNTEYLALAHSTTPFLTIMKRDGDTFTKLPNPSQLPSSTGKRVSFSSDNTYLALSHNISPYISVYKRNGDTFDKLPDTFGVNNNTSDVDFSQDAEYLAVGLEGIAQNVNIYKRNGDSFTKLPNFTSYGIGNPVGVVFGSNRDYLFCASVASGQLHIYKAIYPFNPNTEFAIPTLENLPQEAISGWSANPIKPFIRSDV